MKKYGLESLSLIALVGGMALWGYAAKAPSAGALKGATRANAAQANVTPNKGYLKADKIEGEELARLLELSVFKWKVRFPPGAKSVVFWAEDWRKGREQPDIVALFNTALTDEATSPTAEPATLLIKLPEARDGKFTASLGGSTNAVTLPRLVADRTQGGTSTASSPSMPIFLDMSILLAGTIQNRTGSLTATYDKEHIVKNDRTILYKMHFTKSADGAMPLWENGRVVLKTF